MAVDAEVSKDISMLTETEQRFAALRGYAPARYAALEALLRRDVADVRERLKCMRDM